MKIAYLLQSTFNFGGTERVTINKCNYWAERGDDVTIITTDQRGRANSFALDSRVKVVDLGVNYTLSRDYYTPKSYLCYPFKKVSHKKRLAKVLNYEKFDIVVHAFGQGAEWIHSLKDGSRKVFEFHFSHNYRLMDNRGGLGGMIARLRSRSEEANMKKYDRFVVLTKEDMIDWGESANMDYVYNATSFPLDKSSELSSKRAVAIGRLSYEKGYDNLIEVWGKVAKINPDWQLHIYGSGELEEEIKVQIKDAGLQEFIFIHPPTQKVMDEILDSSMLVSTSRYEGFHLVLVEAMTVGVPLACYAYKNGPSEIIRDGVDGYLVPEGDVEGLAARINEMIENRELRAQMGKNAKQRVKELFTMEVVMQKWASIFDELIEEGKR